MGFIPTSQTEKARKVLQEKRSVVIKGNPGEGKTSTALHLIDNSNYTDQRVVINSPEQWDKVDTKWVKIVVVEDIFGQYDLDPSRLQEWIDTYLKKIQNHVDGGHLQAVITIRDDIFSKASSKLKSFKLFRSDRSLILCLDELQNADKKNILDRELKRNNKDMTVDKIEQCIANFKGLIGFPQCCNLFAGNEDLFVQGPGFFKSPEKFLVNNIRNLKSDSFLSLAFLFCTNEIEEEYLSPSPMKNSKKYLPILQDIARYLNIPFNESTVISLRESYEHYSGLYVKKVSSCQDHSKKKRPYLTESGGKSCIQFQHATIYEAVGQVLGDSYPEMVVKYGGSRYLYQRTYTAKARDDDSQNVFIPVSVYGLLAERMVHDVVEKQIVESVVKHSALKQNEFLTKLKEELQKVNRIRNFLVADPYSQDRFLGSVSNDVSEGKCITFLQYVLQSDDSTVKLVYSHFMEFLACTHNCYGCWQCKEKQKLLELAFYYHHFEISDKLITMNACYTHVSLCNAARHGDLNRVHTILEYLKRSLAFNPECVEARKALCRAYLSRSQDVTEILLQEAITLDSMHVIHAVQHGNIDILMKVVEHLKFHNKWHPCQALNRYWYLFDMYSAETAFAPVFHASSTALYIAFCNEKFDMVDYLLQNEVKESMNMLTAVTEDGSKEADDRVIQYLKVTCIWDPHCDDASQALVEAYVAQKHDVCDMLIQEGVLITMKLVPHLILRSLDYVKTVVNQLKDTGSWDPKCDDAPLILALAYRKEKYDVCDLLIEEGVSLTMRNLPHVVCGSEISLEAVKKAVQHLKDTSNWDPKCEDASKTLEEAYGEQKYDVCDFLNQEEVSLTMKNLPHVVGGLYISLEAVKKAVQHLKDTKNWDPKCDDVSKALAEAYRGQKYDVCDLLIGEGVSLTVKNLPHVVGGSDISLEAVMKAVQHLKDTNNWDPKCEDVSKALAEAYRENEYDVCDLLIQEGVSLTMRNLPHVVCAFEISLEAVKKAIQHLKDTKNWDPTCRDASEALENIFQRNEYDVCDLLIEEGVSLTMKNLPHVVGGLDISLEAVKKAVQHLKDTKNWDPKCEDVSNALAEAYGGQKYEVCDLLIGEEVSLTVKNLPHVVGGFEISLEAVMKAVQHLKDTSFWDPKCEDASKALEEAYGEQKYDVCDFLNQEGVTLTIKNIPGVVYRVSLEKVKKAIQYLNKFDVCDLLIQEQVSVTIKNHYLVRPFQVSLKTVKKAIEHLKDHVNWDPKSGEASEALANAFSAQNYDVCDLLLEEAVSLTMKNFPAVVAGFEVSLKAVKKAMEHLKGTGNWDPKCDDASRALANAYSKQKYDVCDLLIQEGVLLTMQTLDGVVKGFCVSLEAVKKALQHLKDTGIWDPSSEYASKTLENAYVLQKYDVCDLLFQEGVLLTMKNVPGIVYSVSLEYVMNAIEHLNNYELFDLLVLKRVSLSMKNLPCVEGRSQVSLEAVKKVIQHLKDTGKWDPGCDDASKALTNAYSAYIYDVYDLLVHEGVLPNNEESSSYGAGTLGIIGIS